MINSKITGVSQPISYPILMKHDKSNLVVLFSGLGRGVVVVVAGNRKIGHYRDDWLTCSFTPLSHSQVVTLSNE